MFCATRYKPLISIYYESNYENNFTKAFYRTYNKLIILFVAVILNVLERGKKTVIILHVE